MKKLIIAGLFAIVFTSSAFAASDPIINSTAIAHLEASYNDAKNVAWTVTDEFQKASFTSDNTQIDVYYTAGGEFMGSFKTIAYNKLPKAALAILTVQYTFPAYQLKDCIELTDADNIKTYYVSFKTKKEDVALEISNSGAVSKVN